MSGNTVLAITTCRRPLGLEKCLSHCLMLKASKPFRILVVNNDPDSHSSVEDVIKRAQMRHPDIDIELILEPRRGIPFARNAAIRHSLAFQGFRYLAMIDDDEYPTLYWLLRLTRTLMDFHSVIAAGPVVRVFDPNDCTPEIARVLASKTRYVKEGRVPFINTTANVIFDLEFLRLNPSLRFNEMFSLSGGSDYELFKRAKKLGATFSWSPEAQVFEDMPISRLTEEWSLKRAERTAYVQTRVALLHRDIREIATLALQAVAGISAESWRRLTTRDRSRPLASRVSFYRSVGKVKALLGKSVDEYSVTHGS